MSLKHNTLWSLMGSGLPFLAAVFLIPYILKTLGDEAFGVLALVWALIGYFSLFDLGIGRALTYEMSKLKSESLFTEISPTLKAGLLLTTLTGVLGFLILFIAAPLLIKYVLKISITFQADAQLAFQIVAFGVLPTTVTSGLRGALEGLDRFAASNLNKMILGFLMFILPAISIYLHGSVLWLIALYLVIARYIIAIGTVFQLYSHLIKPATHSVFKYFKPLLSYGIWITVTGIVGPLMVYGDRFFVGGAVGVAMLPIYAIPQEGLQRLLILSAALSSALLPRLTAVKKSELKPIYRKNYYRIAIFMLIICIIGALCADWTLKFWLSDEFSQKALPVTLILIIGIFFNSISLVPYTLLHARGNPKITALFHLAELVIYCILLFFLTNSFGLMGAAIALVLRVFIDFVLLNITAEKYLKTTLNVENI